MAKRAELGAREPSQSQILQGATRLAGGEVVAVPTDTVYGLAVALRVRGASRALFALKGRPDSVALPVIVASTEDALALCDPSDRSRLERLADAFWPGDLTVVVRRGPGAQAFDLGADASTIGLRIPDAAAIRELARRVGPLGVSSANRHGAPPAESPQAVRAAFGPELFVVDGGHRSGAVSTVVDATRDDLVLLRPGRIALRALRAPLGVPPSSEQTSK